MLNLHSTKTDNAHIESKINLRKLATAGLDEIRVLDLFAGENKLWASFEKERYYGVEKVKGKGKNLNTDNIRVIQNDTLQKGTVIIYTCITNKMSSLNKCILDLFQLRNIYDKSKTMINGYAVDLFYGMLYSLGVRKVCEYEIKSTYEKHYGFFFV